ncbi:hypothetical protein HZA26_01285 [Candidatus Nomurabacteria bacterium]|nr:hypothetical protein [Candidatus Nomurabacteria bacterium]
MSIEDKDKLNRVEELTRRLFSKNYEPKAKHHSDFTYINKKDVPDSWPEEVPRMDFSERVLTKTSIFKRFFIFSVAFFILALLYASYTFFISGNVVSNDNIEISVIGNTFIGGGEELALVVGVANKNNSPLEFVDLIIEYPKSSVGDLSGDNERLRESLGTIPAGSQRNENIKVVLFGEQGSIRPIKIYIEYRVEGSNAIFVKEKIHEVSINSTPIDLFLDAPVSLSPNQEINLDVKAVLNSVTPVSNILVKVDYPVGFQFVSATPSPSLGNNIWNLGDLAPGSEENINIKGKMVDVSDGEEKVFRVFSGLQSEKDKSMIGVIFNSLSHNVLISKPFIEARLFVNGAYKNEYVVSSKEKLTGEIHWVNNLDTKINDLEIRAKISGNALDKKSVNSQQGFYDSLQDVIIWDKNSQNRLKEVNPGDSGIVSFTLAPTSLFSASGGMLSEPSISIEVSISGKQALAGYEVKELKDSESKKIRVSSDVGLVAKILYYSSSSANTGLIPPKVGKETTYTVSWSISNTSNNISKTEVRSTLPSWVKFVGLVSPTTEDLTFNAFTKEVVWDVGSVKKGAGITDKAKEVFFKISFTPSLSQVDTIPTLVRDTVLTGHDDFANVDVRISKNSLSTNLTSDPGFPPSGAKVVE